MLQANLKVVGGKQDGTVIPLSTKKFLIGREQDCDLRPNSELVSRHHCVITNDGYSIRVRDFGSTNGTFVNGQRVEGQASLSNGDNLTVGSLKFVVELSTADTDAAPADIAPTVPELESPPAPSSDTVFSMRVPESLTEQTDSETVVLSTSDTTVGPHPGMAPEAPAQPEAPQPQQTYDAPPQQELPPQQPTYQQQPGYPQQPVYQQQPGYPQQPGYQEQPGYPQQPVYQQPPAYQQPPGGYPQQPIQYAQQPGQYQQPVQYQQPIQYQQPMAPPPEMAPPTPTDAGAGQAAAPPIRLPPPEETGIQPEAEVKGSGGAGEGKKDDSSNQAADIIRQYQQRRI